MSTSLYYQPNALFEKNFLVLPTISPAGTLIMSLGSLTGTVFDIDTKLQSNITYAIKLDTLFTTGDTFKFIGALSGIDVYDRLGNPIVTGMVIADLYYFYIYDSGKLILSESETVYNNNIYEPQADIASITALDVTTDSAFPSGVLCNVVDQNAIFQLDRASSKTADAYYVIQPATGPGRWLRQGCEVPATFSVPTVHKITAGETASGYFEVGIAPSASTVSVRIHGGIAQFNKALIGATGVTADFEILSTNQLHFNNNGAGTGLSEIITTDDIIIITFIES